MTPTPFGDRAVRFAVPASMAERRALMTRLREVARDVVLCEEIGCAVLNEEADRARISEALKLPIVPDVVKPAQHVVRVRYDGEDLGALDLAREDVVRLHTAGDYHVAMLGFLPGFAYLRGLASELCLPRRAPRPRVPARSVAIGVEYTGIYPVASAGGWHLLGRALDAPRFELGDRVRFEATTEEPPRAEAGREDTAREPRGAHLAITRLAGLALFVDAGRAGQMHRGMPPGGPLVRRTFRRANSWAGNDAAACAIELTGSMDVEARGGAVTVASDARVTLREGDRFTLASGPQRAAYLAIEGGFDAPILEGSRNALLAAGIGRALRRGDVLGRGDAASEPPRTRDLPSEPTAVVALHAGPDLDDELRASIERGQFTISPTSDRAGTRLTGPTLPAARDGRRASTPMVEGAIELTPSGLVVLGPDHPTTGGYPVAGIVASESRDAFFARPLGASVRFRWI